MLTQIINGHILTPQGWMKDGSVLINDGKILEITNSDLAVIGAKVIDVKGMYIVPGFVGMHVHGGGGHDFTEATEEAFTCAVNAHLKHGATSIFPTLSSSSFETLSQASLRKTYVSIRFSYSGIAHRRSLFEQEDGWLTMGRISERT